MKRTKKIHTLLDHHLLMELLRLDSIAVLQKYHRDRVEHILAGNRNTRDGKWTDTTTAGSRSFLRTFNVIEQQLAWSDRSDPVRPGPHPKRNLASKTALANNPGPTYNAARNSATVWTMMEQTPPVLSFTTGAR
ncbi:MAG TPA: hypothetical protein HPP81_01775 [Deltaproteobacteria bacterium]|nr:hypothetical protein [Deltaproteobacteria bacterium]HIJ75423.1 hypothetical protein [Deltaproteobacteria bacterium]